MTYQNAENGYAVIRCRVKSYRELVTAVGVMPEIHAGSVLCLGGQWRMDAKYGRQFAVESYEEALPATVYGMEKYLGSGLIKGIGPKFAKKIVGRFGKDTLSVIEENPERLLEVEGIGRVRVERVKESWQEQKEIKNIVLFLQGHDVSTAHAVRIYKTYGGDSLKIVRENPYRLADDIWGIGFKTADTIAEKLGLGREKHVRIRSGILYALNRLAEGGHCYATRDMLLRSASELLTVDESLISMSLDNMVHEKDVVTDDIPEGKGGAEAEGGQPAGRAIYLAPFFYSEVGVVRRLRAILESGEGLRVDVDGLAGRVAARTGMRYDENQLRAILSAARSKILILTGGPGTGKTATTLGMIAAFREAGARIFLAAPTGRAAKRLSEATGLEAKTIHRLLKAKPPEGYQQNEENPLEGDVLIVDECSMIDLMLMYSLLRATPDSMKLILVGDADQLPSVGAGNVLRDMIASERFPVVRLTKIFRQAQASRIIMSAHRINEGKLPNLSNGADTDFFFMQRETPEEAVQTVVELVSAKLPRYYRLPPGDIQVLTPMQRGVAGAVNLNARLQQALNPGERGLRRGAVLYKAGDRVMQIRNNYGKEVFNGDIGVVASADLEERVLTVDFDGKKIDYELSELDELALAYAVTIHKAQGSEYPVVVMPVLMNHYVMLQRNLIYTGVTRAKRILVIVGTKQALAFAVRKVTAERRNTLLRERLQKALDPARQTLPEGQTERTLLPGDREENAGRAGRSREASLPADQEGRQELFRRLGNSKFRSSFHLSNGDRDYVRHKGMETIRAHAEEFIRKRLAPAVIPNDGRQTPMRGHPVFVAQHATGCCCRSCLEKWHGIPPGRELSEEERRYVADTLAEWIRREMSGPSISEKG